MQAYFIYLYLTVKYNDCMKIVKTFDFDSKNSFLDFQFFFIWFFDV